MRLFGAAAALFFITGILPAVYPSPRERLEEWLDGKGILWEEGFLFADDGGDFAFEFSGETAGTDEGSVLVIFDKNTGETGEAAGDGDGEDDSIPEPRVVLALPLGDGTAEGAFDRRCALRLVEGLSGTALPARVIAAFLGERDLRFLRSGGTGADAGGGGIDAGGVEEEIPGLLSRFPDPERTVFWYLDLPETPAELLVRHGSAGRIAPLEMVKDLTARCESLEIPFVFADPFNELVLSGLADGPAELDSILKLEMAGVFITGTDRQIPEFFQREKIGADRVTELLLRLVSSPPASMLIPPDQAIAHGTAREYRYRIVAFPGLTFYLSERTLICITLAAGVLFFLYLQIFSPFRGLSCRWRIFFRCFPIIPALGAVLGFSLGLSGLAAALAGSLVLAPSFVPALLLPCLRPVLGIGLFIFLTLPLRGYRIPRAADFYGIWAVFFAALNILAAAFVNIVLVPVLAEALIILLPGARFKNSVLVFACAFLAPLHGIFILVFALLSGGGAGFLLLSTGTADIVRMSLALMPFVLMCRRGAAIYRGGLQKRPAVPKKTGT
ncbi:MAG: hypothetical protein LBS06_07700 [Treponema sp.]|nr:hypothetical protein [Treponema sp.]